MSARTERHRRRARRRSLPFRCAGCGCLEFCLHRAVAGGRVCPALRAEHIDLETEREDDGRWIADLTSRPGAMAYGATEHDAVFAALSIGEWRIPGARPNYA